MSGTTDEIKGRVKEAIGVLFWSRPHLRTNSRMRAFRTVTFSSVRPIETQAFRL